MKRLFSALAVVGLMALAACAGSGAATGTTSASVLKATNVALTTYADVYQPAVLAYGKLPVCPAATICHDPVVLGKLKAADLAVTKVVTAAQPILNGSVPDAGQLGDALTAIEQAESTIAGSGALKLN